MARKRGRKRKRKGRRGIGRDMSWTSFGSAIKRPSKRRKRRFRGAELRPSELSEIARLTGNTGALPLRMRRARGMCKAHGQTLKEGSNANNH